MAELQYFKNLDRPSVQITHCSGRIGLNMRVLAASSWPRDSLPLVLIFACLMVKYVNAIFYQSQSHTDRAQKY